MKDLRINNSDPLFLEGLLDWFWWATFFEQRWNLFGERRGLGR